MAETAFVTVAGESFERVCALAIFPRVTRLMALQLKAFPAHENYLMNRFRVCAEGELVFLERLAAAELSAAIPCAFQK